MQKRNNCSYLYTRSPPFIFILPGRFTEIGGISTTSSEHLIQGLTPMQSDQSQRGRPKGTGIDDSSRLRQIAALIAENPELRPTTAIKNIGIFDPSIIRRLRDKFNSNKEQLLSETDCNDFRKAPFRKELSDQHVEARTMALNNSREPTKSEAPASRPSKSDDSNSDDESSKPGFIEPISQDALLRMVSAGLRSASTMFQLQLVIATQSFHSPAMRSALRYQLAFSQAMLGFSGPQRAMPLAYT